MESPFKSRAGLQRLRNALGYSVGGLRAAWRYEHAFRQELFLMLAALPLVFWLERTAFEKMVLVSVLVLVLIVELLNSAVEAVVDRVSLESHPLAARAKDLGSAAVLLAIVHAGAWWVLIVFFSGPPLAA